MIYPAKLCVISPHILTVPMPIRPGSQNSKAIYLLAFAGLLVRQDPQGRFTFEQVYRLDRIGAQSIELLTEMCDLVAATDMTLAAFRLSDLAKSLLQVPMGSEHQAQGKVALLRWRDAIFRQPIDVAFPDAEGGLQTLKREALSHDLMAEWDEPGASHNPGRLRLQLCDRTQAMWLAIAREHLSSAKMQLAEDDFLAWKEDELID